MNKLDAELKKSDPDLKIIAVLQVQLKDKFQRLEDNQNLIEDKFLEREGFILFEDNYNTSGRYPSMNPIDILKRILSFPTRKT